MREAASVLLEFSSARAIEHAAKRLSALGYTRLDAYTPHPIAALDPYLRLERSPIPKFVLAGGVIGALVGYGLQYWLNGIDYPLDVGGRPLHSAPAFIPITFESTILAAALSGFAAFFFLTRLPRLHHPLFEVEGFERATIDRFFLEVSLDDPKLDLTTLRAEATALDTLRIVPVGAEEAP